MTNPMLDAALDYAARGWRVLPLDPRGKRPATARGVNDATTDVEQIARWWPAAPGANVGIATGGGFFVVDVDGPEGVTALTEAGVTFDSKTPRVITGKGVHYYLAGDAPNRIGLLPKVDVRSAGSYVVAPPSVHANGRVYEWSSGVPDVFGTPPPTLLALLRPKGAEVYTASAGPDWAEAALRGVGEGERDATCTRLAGYLLGRGVSSGAVEAILTTWGEKCTPPFPADQVRKCTDSIARRHAGRDNDTDDTYDVSQFIDRLVSPGAPKRVVSTGLSSLDVVLNGGLYPGQLVYLAGIGGTGKSIAAQAAAIRAAEAGDPVVYASLEMPVDDCFARLVSFFSFTDSRYISALAHGHAVATATDVKRLRAVQEEVSALPLVFRHDLSDPTAIEKTLASRPDTKLLVVDQVHHMRHPDGTAGMHGLEANSRALVDIAGRFNVPVIGICQVNRPDSYQRTREWRPTRYSLRGSEQLYHDPAVVLLCHRSNETPGVLEIQVAKSRMGGASDQWLKFSYAPQWCRVGD